MTSFPDSSIIHLYPVVIHQSRYGGVYEGAKWFCVPNCDSLPTDAIGDDETCVDFWFSERSSKIGIGDSPNEAFFSMLEKNGHQAELQEPSYRDIVKKFERDAERHNSVSTRDTMRSIRLERTNYFDSATGFAEDQ